MKPINFKYTNCKIAEKQPEYQTLPAYRQENDKYGRITSCWKLSFSEKLKVIFTGKIFFQQMTFNDPLQPQLPAASFRDLYILNISSIGSALGIFHYYRNEKKITIRLTWFSISFYISPFPNFRFLSMRKFSQWSHNIRFKIQRKYTRKEFNKIQDNNREKNEKKH